MTDIQNNVEKLIKNTMLQLMEYTPFEKIRVQKIVENADINRSTFYAHYIDKYDLLEKIEDEIIENLKKSAMDTNIEMLPKVDNKIQFIMPYTNNVISQVYENRTTIKVLLSENGDKNFINKFKCMIEDVWNTKGLTDNVKASIPSNYLFGIITGVIGGVLEEWIKSDFKESKEEIIQIILCISNGVVSNIFE